MTTHPEASATLTRPSDGVVGGPVDSAVDRAAAAEFLEQFHAETTPAGPAAPRIAEVLREIDATGTYTHTAEELAFGARVAWRNAARCIGRLYWRSLQVRDLRHGLDAVGVAASCVAHLREADQRRPDPADDHDLRAGAPARPRRASGTSS